MGRPREPVPLSGPVGVTVACVYRTGGAFTADYVTRLQRAVARNLSQRVLRYEFVCLTDRPVPGVTCLPLTERWPGWWAKLELFEPGRFCGPVLYLDLDTVVVGDLLELAQLPDEVLAPAALEDFYAHGKRASGVMAWDAAVHGPELAEVWRRFCADPAGIMVQNGRRMDKWLGATFERQDPIQRMLPGQVVSYKIHCGAGVPPDARLVCFHGTPRLSELAKGGAIRTLWEGSAT